MFKMLSVSLYVCVCVSDANYGGANRNHCTETCNLACTYPMNPDQKPGH